LVVVEAQRELTLTLEEGEAQAQAREVLELQHQGLLLAMVVPPIYKGRMLGVHLEGVVRRAEMKMLMGLMQNMVVVEVVVARNPLLVMV
jgi:hypothetical protein